MSSSGMMVPLVSGTSSYSWCAKAGRGGVRALRSSRDQTGMMDGVVAPRASSATAFKNWTRPCASDMVWLSLVPKTKPPHLSRVTCHHILLIFIILYHFKFISLFASWLYYRIAVYCMMICLNI